MSSVVPVLLNAQGERIDAEKLLKKARSEPQRVLADDEIGTVIYVGDLDIYTVSGIGDPVSGVAPLDQSGFWVKRVSQISIVRFPAPILRHQIGSAVVTVSADSVFVVRSGAKLKKVRGDMLKAGMVLVTGTKVYW